MELYELAKFVSDLRYMDLPCTRPLPGTARRDVSHSCVTLWASNGPPPPVMGNAGQKSHKLPWNHDSKALQADGPARGLPLLRNGSQMVGWVGLPGPPLSLSKGWRLIRILLQMHGGWKGAKDK